MQKISLVNSSRRGRPPKQGLSGLSSYEDFNEDDPVRLKKYRVDEKDSPHDDLNGKLSIYFWNFSPICMFLAGKRRFEYLKYHFIPFRRFP